MRIDTKRGVSRFLQGETSFDTGVFGIVPLEALLMDPQQRMMLEVRASDHLSV